MLKILAIAVCLAAGASPAWAQSWTAKAPPPAPIGAGAAATREAGRWYVLAGGLTPKFLGYDLGADTWFTFAPLPEIAGLGAGIAGAGDGDTVYAVAGSGSVNCYRYSISAGTWSLHSVLPFAAGDGSALFGAAGELHVLQGGTTNHWEYDPMSLAWMAAAPAPFPCAPGTRAMKADAGTAIASGPTDLTFWYYFASTDTWGPGPTMLDFLPPGGGFARINGGLVVESPLASVRVRVYEESSTSWRDRPDPTLVVSPPVYLPEADQPLRLSAGGLELYVPAPAPADCGCEDETELGGGCSAGGSAAQVLPLAAALALLAYRAARRTRS